MNGVNKNLKIKVVLCSNYGKYFYFAIIGILLISVVTFSLKEFVFHLLAGLCVFILI